MRAQICLDSLLVILLSLLFIIIFISNFKHIFPYTEKVGIIIKIKEIENEFKFGLKLLNKGYKCFKNYTCYMFSIPRNLHLIIKDNVILVVGSSFMKGLLSYTGNFSALRNISEYCMGTETDVNGHKHAISYVFKAGICYKVYDNGTQVPVAAKYCVCKYPGISGTGGLQFFTISESVSSYTSILWDFVENYGFVNSSHLVILGRFEINKTCKEEVLRSILKNYVEGKNFICKNLSDTPYFSYCLGMYILEKCSIPSYELSVFLIPLDLNFSQVFPITSFSASEVKLTYTDRTVPGVYVLSNQYLVFPKRIECLVNLNTNQLICNYSASFYEFSAITFIITHTSSGNTLKITYLKFRNEKWRPYICIKARCIESGSSGSVGGIVCPPKRNCPIPI